MGNARRATPHGQSRRVQIHQEGRNDPWPRRREQDHEIGDIGVADEMLAAIDHVVAAVTNGAGGHRPDIRARARFGDRKAVHAFAADRGPWTRRLGFVRGLQGETREAIGHFEEAVRLDPRLFDARYHLDYHDYRQATTSGRIKAPLEH